MKKKRMTRDRANRTHELAVMMSGDVCQCVPPLWQDGVRPFAFEASRESLSHLATTAPSTAHGSLGRESNFEKITSFNGIQTAFATHRSFALHVETLEFLCITKEKEDVVHKKKENNM